MGSRSLVPTSRHYVAALLHRGAQFLVVDVVQSSTLEQVVGHVETLLTQALCQGQLGLGTLRVVTALMRTLGQEFLAGSEGLLDGGPVVVVLGPVEGLAQAGLTRRRVGHVDPVATHALGEGERLDLLVEWALLRVLRGRVRVASGGGDPVALGCASTGAQG